jgi:DNA topoisomerase VI subunit B
MVSTWQEKVGVSDGHPFIIEAGVSLGGKDVNKPGVYVYRFANRIPLLFEKGSDVATVTATRRIKWSQYKISHTAHKIGVFISIVSTKVPYKGTSKEYIGDDVLEIRDAVQKAIMQCCSQLKVKLAKQKLVRDAQQRKKRLHQYIPNVSRALHEILEDMVERQAKKQKVGDETNQAEVDSMLERVKQKEVSESILTQRLTNHVEQIDVEQALQHVAAVGLDKAAKEPMHIVPLGSDPIKADKAIQLHAPTFSFELMRSVAHGWN